MRTLALTTWWFGPFALGLAFTSAVAAQDPQAVWQVEEWRPGVFASVVRDGVPYSLYATSLIVVGEDGVLVVDPRDTPRAALDLLAAIRARTELPVRWVVNTHWHWDHVGGNQVFADSFPDLEIVAHPDAARRLREDGAARFQEEIQRLEARRQRLLRWQSAGKTDDGEALSDDDRAQIVTLLARDRVRIDDLRQVRITLPTREIVDEWSPVGWEERVRVRHLGPGHTPGDLIVEVPDAGVSAAGDLIEHGLPWFGDGTVTGSGASLEALAGARGLLLPGHGPIPTDRSLLEGQRAFMEAAFSALESVWTSDQRVEEALAAFDAGAHHGAFPGASDSAYNAFVRGVLEQRALERR